MGCLCGLVALLAAGCATRDRHGHHVWNDFEIHPHAVDPAVLGISVARLERVLGPDFTVSAPVESGELAGWREVSTREGQLLYFVKPGKDDRIERILVIDPRFATAEGIGAGASIEAAAAAYGSPVFTRSKDGRETAMFPGLTGRSLAIHAAPPPGRGWAGDYRGGDKLPDGSTVTTRWRPGSSVRSVEVSAL